MKTLVIEPRKWNPTATMFLTVLFIALFVLVLYTFLHESGHALSGFLSGQKLAEFHINLLKWEAHVRMVGDLTSSQQALQSLAGGALPLLLWFVGINFVPRKMSFTLEILKLLGSMVVLNTLLAWIALPVLYLFAKAPPDDVTHFLQYSHMSPLLLTFTAAILYARGWSLFLSKIDGLRNTFLLFRTTDRETLTAGMRTSLPVLSGILAFCVLLTFVLNNGVADPSLRSASPPPNFGPVAEIDLSRQAYADQVLAHFTLEKAALVGVFITIRDINTTYFDLRVTGPDGYSSIILHGEGYRVAQDGGLWEANLAPGTYQVLLTSHQSPGTASVFLRTPESVTTP